MPNYPKDRVFIVGTADGDPNSIIYNARVNSSGEISVVNAALPLPAGASTEAKQDDAIENQTDGTQQSKITDGTNVADVQAHGLNDADKGLVVIPVSNDDTITIHLRAQNVTADTYIMAVDVSDTTNWPHLGGTVVHVDYISVNINPATNFDGDITIGFLTSVDGTNGDFNIVNGWHLERQSTEVVSDENYSPAAVICSLGSWFGPTDADVTALNTGTNLIGPDDNTAYPSGNGDLIVFINVVAGAVDFGMVIGYHME